jgi:peptidyl-prolyl cis-trans isomerase C
MKLHCIRFLTGAAIALSFVTIAHSQNSLPINAAASVNGVIISNDMVEQGIQAALSQGQKDSPELRNLVLGKMIEMSLLSQQAEKNGLADSDKANIQLALIRQNYLADLELSSFMSKSPVTDADVQAEYNREIASLGPQGMIVEYKVSDLVVATEAEAQAALARTKKGESFDKVVKSVSLAPNKAQGGAVGQTLPQIANVLVTLSKGQISPAPIQMPQGWYLIKLEDKKSSKPPTFEQAKAVIRNALLQKKQYEYLSQLRQSSNIVLR